LQILFFGFLLFWLPVCLFLLPIVLKTENDKTPPKKIRQKLFVLFSSGDRVLEEAIAFKNSPSPSLSLSDDEALLFVAQTAAGTTQGFVKNSLKQLKTHILSTDLLRVPAVSDQVEADPVPNRKHIIL